MLRKWIGLFAALLMVAAVGCEGEPKPTVEEQKPDFGQKTGDQMKNMIGVPGKGGQMQPATPAPAK